MTIFVISSLSSNTYIVCRGTESIQWLQKENPFTSGQLGRPSTLPGLFTLGWVLCKAQIQRPLLHSPSPNIKINSVYSKTFLLPHLHSFCKPPRWRGAFPWGCVAPWQCRRHSQLLHRLLRERLASAFLPPALWRPAHSDQVLKEECL